jgi:hypothetical protein
MQVLQFIDQLKVGRRQESAFFLKGGHVGTANFDFYQVRRPPYHLPTDRGHVNCNLSSHAMPIN